MASFKSADSTVSVTLHSNPFSDEEGSYYGRVSRNTVNLENLISAIQTKNPSIEPYGIEHSAKLLGDEMECQLKAGRAVDVLGLGTIYPAVSGGIKGENPGAASIGKIRVGYTASKKASEAVACVKIDKVVIGSSVPVIDSIVNLSNQASDYTLTVGKSARITGTRLKITGGDGGIFFAPSDESGKMNRDESTWLKVGETQISTNKPKTLEFFLPDSLSQAGKYFIVLRTRYSSSNTELKASVQTVSKIVTVNAA